MHIRDLRRNRPILDFKTASTISTSIVHAKLDYFNARFLNIDRYHPNKPPPSYSECHCPCCHQNPKQHHITSVLKSLHSLKIPERIEYKVIGLSLTYNTLQSSQPS